MARLSPADYADRYHKLDVYCYTEAQAQLSVNAGLPPGGAWHTVDVHYYRLNKAKKDAPPPAPLEALKSKVRPHFAAKNASVTVWVKNAVSGAVESKTYPNRVVLAENLNDPFYGKGSPEECQVALQLAVRYEHLTVDGLQGYLDGDNIGLDCSGFVGCYLRHVVQELPWETDARSKEDKSSQFDANSLISSIMKLTGKVAPIKELSEFEIWTQSPFILAMSTERGVILDHSEGGPDQEPGFGHIMITQPNTAQIAHNAAPEGLGFLERSIQVKVVESTGGKGLTESTYTITYPNDYGAFHIHRGSKNKTMWVKAVRLTA
jgi:hypothetical protein